MVFEKLQKEGFAGLDDVRLRTAMKVPRSAVGRVIGKQGKNVSSSYGRMGGKELCIGLVLMNGSLAA